VKSSEIHRTAIPFIILLAVVTLLPIIIRSAYILSVMVFIAVYGVLALGLSILIGHAGLFSLAHPVWFGLGAYISGILAARGLAPPGIGIIISAFFVALISCIIGAPLLRLRGYYLACATFALLLIAQIAGGQLTNITGGHEGLLGIPPLSVGGFVFQTDLHYYYLSWALCIACFWFCSNLIHSRIGRAIRSFHDSEIASESMGVNISKYKLQIFILTSVMASLAGSIFCFYLCFTIPSFFGFHLLVELLMMVVIGGIGSIQGPLIGSFVILWLREIIHLYFGKVFPVMTAEVDAIFFGVLIIIILIFMPHGLAGGIDQLFYLGRRTYAHFKNRGAQS
jgi:branched-chain amino acid transport system permease protein